MMGLSTLTQHLGIETECGVLVPVFFSGTRIPCQRRGLLFSPSESGQRKLTIKIRQGEFHQASNDMLLGVISFEEVINCYRGIPYLCVDCLINKVGRLTVRVTDLRNNEFRYFFSYVNFLPREKITEEQISLDKSFYRLSKKLVSANEVIRSYRNLVLKLNNQGEHSKSIIDNVTRKVDRLALSMAKKDEGEIDSSIKQVENCFEELSFAILSGNYIQDES